MATSYGPICQEVEKYFKLKQENPNHRLADPVGSFKRTSECRCRFCGIACETYGKNESAHGHTDPDKSVSSLEAFAYCDGNERTRNDGLVVEFRKSGMHFCQGFSYSHKKGTSEVFVQEGKIPDRASKSFLNGVLETGVLETGVLERRDVLIPLAKSISGDTGSETSFTTALGWLEECLKSHRTLCPLIASPDGPPKLPTRVIDVGTPIKLVETNNTRGLYACLSHCWGKKQPLTTTRTPDTLERHLKEIQWEQLPKTFQEAVRVTRQFGIQYLWIDSLCIIQDDAKDWQIESAQMASTYQNAVITFAGSASSGHSEGLFRRAHPDHIDHALPPSTKFAGIEKIRTRQPLPHDAEYLPLMHRGWVFQERLLSPRYLHFGQNELLWECMERLTCECGGISVDDPLKFTWLSSKNRLFAHPMRLLKESPWENIQSWHSAVADYSQTNLSRAEDIFPAISGIVKDVTSATEWTYVAGLWKENLAIDMTWTVEKPSLSRRCKKWRAPTFSWASVISSVEKEGSSISFDWTRFLWRGLNDQDLSAKLDIYVKVVETYCQPIGHDPTGQLSSSHIILCGTIIKATLQRSEKKDWQIVPFSSNEPLLYSRFRNDCDLDSENCGIASGDTVFCLKLIGSSQIPARSKREYLLHMVLKKVQTGYEKLDGVIVVGEYERIGLLRDANGDDEDPLQKVSEESAIQRDVVVKIV